MLNPQGFVSECTGENIFVARDGMLITPPIVGRRARGHHPGLGHDHRPATSASRSAFDDLTRSDLYVAEEMFVCGTAAEVSAVNSVDDRADPVPRPDDHGHRRGVRQGRPRPGRPLQGLGRAMSTDASGRRVATPARARVGRDLRHDAARRRPVRGHLAHRRGQAARRRAARLARRALDRGRLPAGQPEGRRVLPAGPRPSCTLDDRRRWWPSARPAARRARSTSTPRCRPWSRPGRPRCASSARAGTSTSPRRCRPPSTRAWPWWATRCEFLKAAGLRVFFDAEHFFDGYKANPEYALRVLEAAAANGADCVVLCDTNGGSLPHEVAAHRRRGRRLLRRRCRVGIHTQNDTGCAVANSVAAVLGGATPGAGHDQRLRRAHRQRQPHDRHPRPHAEAGRRDACPRAASSGSPR